LHEKIDKIAEEKAMPTSTYVRSLILNEIEEKKVRGNIYT